MLENIALMKEVHEGMPTQEAQSIAKTYLAKIGIEKIANNRLTQCNSLEIFYVMLLRALMHNKDTIMIVTPFFLIKKLSDIGGVLENISLLNSGKTLLILDNISNQSYYEGKACNIIK